MLGTDLVGRTLDWRPFPDPPGAWAFTAGDRVVAELEWTDGRVRAESLDEVGYVDVWGTWMLRAAMTWGVRDAPLLCYAGDLLRGLARGRDGMGFTFVRGLQRGVGPWEGVDHAGGNGVLRIRRRGVWSEVRVTPDPVFATSVGPLLVLWGALRLVHSRRPWLIFTAATASERAVQREIERLSVGS